MQVVIGYTVGVAAMLLAFWNTPASLPWLQWATVFMIGFFLYGPQMLIGLCGAELVGPESVGASEGFLGWVAYLGEALSAAAPCHGGFRAAVCKMPQAKVVHSEAACLY